MKIKLTLEKIIDSKDYWDEEVSFEEFEIFILEDFQEDSLNYLPELKEIKE